MPEHHRLDCHKLWVIPCHLPCTVQPFHLLAGAFISLLIVHSLGRVVHRHERESWIQRSATRTALTQGPTRNSGRLSRRAQTGQLTSSFVTSSRTRSIRERYRGDPNDPFSDTRPLDQERFSWQFGTVEGSSSNNHAPLLLSVRNVTHDSQYTQEFEFEPALERNTSWQPNAFSSNGVAKRLNKLYVLTPCTVSTHFCRFLCFLCLFGHGPRFEYSRRKMNIALRWNLHNIPFIYKGFPTLETLTDTRYEGQGQWTCV